MSRSVGEEGSPAVDPLTAALDSLAAADPAGVDDEVLREQVRLLVTACHRLHAELVRRVDVFDSRHLAGPDGFGTTKGWLRAFTQVSGQVAHRLVKTARVLRGLPELAAAARAGDASADHLQQVVRLVDQVGSAAVVEVGATLAQASGQLDSDQFATVCARVRAHVDPDGVDPGVGFERRGLTLASVADTVVLRGQLDAEGGAVLATALDAAMGAPVAGDERTAAQRRADALVELARRPLAGGGLPSVAGHRPQVGVLVFPQALSPRTLGEMARIQAGTAAAVRLRQFAGELATAADDPVADDPAADDPAAGAAAQDAVTQGDAALRDAAVGDAAVGDAVVGSAVVGPAGGSVWQRPGWNDPPWLNWVGAVPHEVAQRIACDADVYRIILDPVNGQPLDVGRAHRLVPYWMRRALYARDRGCRWPGCATPAEWSDAHHLIAWADGGQTSLEQCLLLCRHHHGLVHEGGWSIHRDQQTGEVTVTRPGGLPYRSAPPRRSGLPQRSRPPQPSGPPRRSGEFRPKRSGAPPRHRSRNWTGPTSSG